MDSKITKQGVRDLNSLGPKVKKAVVTEPPKAFMCQHSHTQEVHSGYVEVCKDCGAQRDRYADLGGGRTGSGEWSF